MSGEYSVVYDASALLEFFAGTAQGKQVAELFEDDDVENIVPSIVLCEIISKLKRADVDPAEYVSALENNAVVLELDKKTAKDAGLLHAELKKQEPGIALSDCIIMVHAKMKGAMIVSKDRHFKHYENSKLLG
ncbi:MAG: PIN domain-containing protein [Candidatus Micrarchaeota archaeon]